MELLQSALTLLFETVATSFVALMIFDFVTRLARPTEIVIAPPATEPVLEMQAQALLLDPWESEVKPTPPVLKEIGFVFQLCLPPALVKDEVEVVLVPDFSQMKLKDLKLECAKRGIVPKGNKSKSQTWLDALMVATR